MTSLRSSQIRHTANSVSLIAYVLILLGAFALRLWNLGTQSLWHDEAWSVFSGYTPFAPMGIRGADVNAPFAFYASLGLWLRLAGDEVWTMRYWSLLLGVITVAVTAWTAHRLFGRKVALAAAFFVAVNPILWVFSQEIRAYVVIPLAAVALLGLVERWLNSAHLVNAVLGAIALIELIALYSQNLAVPLVAWINITVAAVLVWQRSWRKLVLWLAVQLVLFVFYLPWLITQRPTGTALNTPPTINAELLWNIWQSHFTGIKALNNADPLLSSLIAAFGIVGLIAVVLKLRENRSLGVMLVISQVILIPVLELGIILAAHIDFHPRYFIVSVPAALMLIAWGVNPQLDTRSYHSHRTFWPSWRFLLIIVAAAIMLRMSQVMYSSPIYQHDDFRSIALRYANLTEKDAIVVPYGWEPTLDYYSRKLGFRASFVEIPLHSSVDTVVNTLTETLVDFERAELLTWYQLPADARGLFPCILNVMGSRSDDVLTVSGIRTERFEGLTSVVRDQQQDGKTALTEPLAGKLPTRMLWGDHGVCLISQWELTTPTFVEWHLTARMQSDTGDLLGQVDTLMLDDHQRPSSFWTPGLFAQPQFLPLWQPAPNPLTIIFGVYHDGVPNVAYTWLSNYTHLYQPPESVGDWQPVTAQFGDFGALVGYMAEDVVKADEMPSLTLLWHPRRASSRSYRVFVHLINEDQDIIAQADGDPASGMRPTFSWITDEYIYDRHRLTFNNPAFRGQARFAVGLYDPVTGERVKLADGTERAVLPIIVSVE